MTNGLRLQVAFFKTEGGREPVREWLLAPPRAERQAIGTDLLDVQYGWPVEVPLVRKLAPDLWEVRSDPEWDGEPTEPEESANSKQPIDREQPIEHFVDEEPVEYTKRKKIKVELADG